LFPPICLFSSEHDIFTPDQELFAEKAINEGVEVEVVLGKNMLHVWPIVPIMSEAKMARDKIISIIKSI